MNTLIKRTVGIMLVTTCMLGTTAFADNPVPPNENEVPQECVVMEVASAMDILGGIPDNITGPDREDLEVILADIDVYMATGNFEMVDELWGYVYEILDRYVVEDPDGFQLEQDDSDVCIPAPYEMPVEDQIAYLEELIAYNEAMGNQYAAESLRAELEELINKYFGEEPMDPDFDPDVDDHEPMDPDFDPDVDDHEPMDPDFDPDLDDHEPMDPDFDPDVDDHEPMDPDFDPDVDQHEPFDPDMESEFNPDIDVDLDHIIGELETEIRRLEEAGDFEAAEAVKAELERVNSELNTDCGFDEDAVNMDDVVRGMEEEIGRLIEAGDYEAAEALRAELDRILSGNGEGQGFEEPQTLTPEDMIERLQGHIDPIDLDNIIRTLDEIRMLEEAGEHEIADQLRADLEGFVNDILGDNEFEDPEGPYIGPDVVSVEDILNKAGHELTPDDVKIIEDLVNKINDIIGSSQEF